MIKVPPKPGRVRAFYASKDYNPADNAELSLKEGDLVFIEDGQPGASYFNVSHIRNSGIIAASYVNNGDNFICVEYPLHEAAKRGNQDYLSECLNNKISVNSLDKSGSTALYWAVSSGHNDIVQKLLLVPNIAISAQNKMGDSALHAASRKGHIECIKLLLDNGASPHIRNKDGKTATDLAKTVEIAAVLKLALEKVVPETQDEYVSSAEEDTE